MNYGKLHHVPLTTDELDEMIERVREGDDYAMKYIVANNIKLILKFIGGWGAVQEDVFHDIVPYIMRAVEKFDGSKGCFSGYMRGAVKWGKWQRYDKLRRKAAQEEKVIEEIRNTRIYYRRSPSPEEIYMSKEYRKLRKEALSEAMQHISIRQRWMVREHYMKGKTYMEIAEEDGTSHQNVQQTVFRALEKMLPYIEKHRDDLR